MAACVLFGQSLLCMFLLRNKEEVVFVQKNGVENRADDVASESWLLPTDSLNGAPFYLSNDMFGDFELTICRKIAIDLQQFFLFSFGSCTCADINELCHEFVQHFALLPFLKSLSWRALVEIKVLEVERQLWQVVLDLSFIPHIGSTALRGSCAFELIVKPTLLFCCHTL